MPAFTQDSPTKKAAKKQEAVASCFFVARSAGFVTVAVASNGKSRTSFFCWPLPHFAAFTQDSPTKKAAKKQEAVASCFFVARSAGFEPVTLRIGI